jgi:shikimate dehydrogenase
VLLIGAGGAGAGALGPLIAERPAELWLVNRTVDKAHELVRRHLAHAQDHGVALHSATLDAAPPAFDVVVNASSSSLHDAAVPVAANVLSEGGLALDMMYGPAALPFLRWAERHGARARDGLGMLVEQAAEAFFFWRGVRPETQPVLQSLRERLDSATS